MKWCLASTAIAIGAVLLILNIAGFFIPIAEHPEAAKTHVHKIRLVRPSYQESIEALSHLDKSWPPEQLVAEQIASLRLGSSIIGRIPVRATLTRCIHFSKISISRGCNGQRLGSQIRASQR
jgi:hypothetical protein